MTKSRRAIYDENARRVAATSPYGKRFSELVEASRAVGATEAQQLAWVTRFVGEDPNLWNSATERSHANCLTVLAGGMTFPEFFLGGIPLPQPLDLSEIRVIHQSVRELLRKAVNADVVEMIEIPMQGVSRYLYRQTKPGKKPAIWHTRYRSQTPVAAVLQTVANLVCEAGDRLIACQSCGNPIVSVKKQLFCNPSEAQKVRNDRREQRRQHGKTKTRPR